MSRAGSGRFAASASSDSREAAALRQRLAASARSTGTAARAASLPARKPRRLASAALPWAPIAAAKSSSAIGSAALPIADEDFAAAIGAQGKAAEANLRGFRAGSDAARAAVPVDLADAAKRWRKAAASLESLEAEAANLPEPARDIVVEGLRRLVDYQGLAYAARYLARLVPIAAADTDAGLNGVLLREAARHLALRMSFEDVMRVAQAKIDPARLARIRASRAGSILAWATRIT